METHDFKMQELHTPSAFEGALWAALGVRDAVTVLHSPPGCYFNQHNNALSNDWAMELYTSNLSYSSIMQGGEAQLEGLLETLAGRHPAGMFVVTAPATEVTQDDVEGVCAKLGYPNTVVVRPPMGGTCGQGKEAWFEGSLAIMDADTPKRPRSVNIIGPTFSTFNWRADVYELRRMLEAIGIEVNAVLTAGASVAELKSAPGAELNLCIYPFDCGVETARAMQERFGTPMLADVIPVGFENSAKWLEAVAAHFDIDASAFLKESVQNAVHFMRSTVVFNTTFELTTALSFENHNTYGVGIAEFFTKELGVGVPMAALSRPDAAKRLEGVCDEVLLSPTLDEKRNKYVETAPTVIFGNIYDKKVSADEGFKNFIFADIPTVAVLASENCPFMGFMGAKYLVQTLVNQTVVPLLLETKGEIAGPIATGVVEWSVEAEQVLQQVSHAVPYFIRAFAVKKMHTGSEELAQQRGTSVTVDMVREVSASFTPARFKAKFGSIFDAAQMEVAERSRSSKSVQTPVKEKSGKGFWSSLVGRGG